MLSVLSCNLPNQNHIKFSIRIYIYDVLIYMFVFENFKLKEFALKKSSIPIIYLSFEFLIFYIIRIVWIGNNRLHQMESWKMEELGSILIAIKCLKLFSNALHIDIFLIQPVNKFLQTVPLQYIEKKMSNKYEYEIWTKKDRLEIQCK